MSQCGKVKRIKSLGGVSAEEVADSPAEECAESIEDGSELRGSRHLNLRIESSMWLEPIRSSQPNGKSF
jgi:hypothetical protein